jgi:group I intron endonuclease
MKCAVYTIVNKINNKIYVGGSANIAKRKREHFNLLRKGKHPNSRLQHDYNIFGEDAFEFEIIIESEKDFLCSEEHYWCTLLNSNDSQYGYNIKITNPTNFSGNIAEESKLKIGNANRGKSGNLGYRYSEEYKKRLSDSWYMSDKTKSQISKSVSEIPRPIYQYDLEGNFIKEWQNRTIAAKELGIDPTNISRCGNLKRKTAGNYIWRKYKNEKI